jgi:uncharacterized membrane protein YhaH (DUF805 family)
VKWYLRALKYSANISGRANRREYWTFVLATHSITILLILLTKAVTTVNLDWIIGIHLFASAIPSFTVQIRRYHDIDRSGWWQLVPIVSFWFTIKAGTNGPNRFEDLDASEAQGTQRYFRVSQSNGDEDAPHPGPMDASDPEPHGERHLDELGKRAAIVSWISIGLACAAILYSDRAAITFMPLILLTNVGGVTLQLIYLAFSRPWQSGKRLVPGPFTQIAPLLTLLFADVCVFSYPHW